MKSLTSFFRNPFHQKVNAGSCQPIEHLPAQYIDKIHVIRIEPILEPIYEEVEEVIIIRPAAINQVIKCNPESGEPMLCHEVVEELSETVRYKVINGYKEIQKGERKVYNTKEKIADGVPLLDCSSIVPPA